jgi:hypothetical protein
MWGFCFGLFALGICFGLFCFLLLGFWAFGLLGFWLLDEGRFFGCGWLEEGKRIAEGKVLEGDC